MSDLTPFSRFQSLLADIFQFDTGDLDFGIYRILNAKRKQVETFIETDLQSVVDQAFGQYAEAKTNVASGDMEEARKKVLDAVADDAFDESGQLKPEHQNTKAGQAYLVTEKAAATSTTTASLKAKVYNDLLTFFSRYYDEGDFLPLRRAGRDMTYAIPYNGEEVTLYWANKGQYYIKTDDRLAAYRFRAGAFHVALEVRSAQTEQNNNKGAKRYYLLAQNGSGAPDVRFDADTQTLHVPFVQRPLTEAEEKEYGKTEVQRPQDSLNKATVASVLAAVPEPNLHDALAAPYAAKEGELALTGAPATLLRHLSQFTKKNTADFFIHKNLSVFLRGELDQFIKTESLRLDELLNGGEGDYALQVARARATKLVGDKIIMLLAQVEDFQKKLFEKRKFVMRTDYVFTLDRVPLALHERVLANAAQVQEWRDLYDVDGLLAADKLLGGGGLTPETVANEPYRRLPVDTRHFDAAFKAELLGNVEDLDALTDGVLFNSENFQALALMTDSYRKRVKCIYIDPPYNAKTSEILYKNTFKHDAWLTLMADRIQAGRTLLPDDGILVIAIDENERDRLGLLLEELFRQTDYSIVCVSVVHNPRGIQGEGFSFTHEYAYFVMPKRIRLPKRPIDTTKQKPLMKTGSESMRDTGRNSFYPIYVKDERVTRLGEVPADDFHPSRSWTPNDDGEIAVYPLDSDGVERKWRYIASSLGPKMEDVTVRSGRDGFPVIYLGKNEEAYRTIWADASYNAAEYGTTLLKKMLGTEAMPENLYPKSINTVKDCIGVAVGDNEAYVIDFFGGSGTTGHAVIEMNRYAPDEVGHRRYIIVEMGRYFDSVLLKRLKKAVFASAWSDGKPTSRDAVSQTIKYHTLEQYEDSLNNLQLRPDAETQKALDVFGDDYLLQYMLDFDTAGSPSLLNVTMLTDPLAYTLRVKSGDDFIHQAVDLPETFSYLLGLRVRKIRTFSDAGREYRAVLGDKDGVKVAHIWRKSSDLADNADGLARDEAFLTGKVLPDLAPMRPDRVFVNGAFTLIGAENCEPELFRLMFAPVGA